VVLLTITEGLISGDSRCYLLVTMHADAYLPCR